MNPELEQLFYYNPGKFVERPGDIAKIKQVLDTVKAPGPGITRAVVFRSESGTGKTFFSFYLNETYFPAQGVKSMLVCFGPPAAAEPITGDYEQSDYTQCFALTYIQGIAKTSGTEREELVRGMVHRILTVLKTFVKAPGDKNGDPTNISSFPTKDVEKVVGKYKFALILDSILEQEWDILRQLDKYILGPLSDIGNVLIVMTGRGRLYRWESPSLQAEPQELAKLDIEELLRKRKSELALKFSEAEIKKLSNNNPKSALILGSVTSKEKGLEIAVKESLGAELAEKYFDFFIALSVWDGFRQDGIGEVIDTYRQDIYAQAPKYTGMPRAKIQDEIINPLIQSQYVRWEDGKYKMDEALRSLILKYLCYKDTGKEWVRLHQAVAKVYTKFARDERNTREEDVKYFEEIATDYNNRATHKPCQEQTLEINQN